MAVSNSLGMVIGLTSSSAALAARPVPRAAAVAPAPPRTAWRMNARRDSAAVPPDRFAFRVFVFMRSSTRQPAAGFVPILPLTAQWASWRPHTARTAC